MNTMNILKMNYYRKIFFDHLVLNNVDVETKKGKTSVI